MLIFIIRVVETFFRHKFLYLAPIPLLLAVGAVMALSSHSTYVSSSAVLVQKDSVLVSLASSQAAGFSWVTPAEAATKEVKELFSTDAFIWAIIMQTDLKNKVTTLEESRDLVIAIRSAMWVNTWGERLILIGAANEDPALAEQLVSSAISTFLNWQSRNEQEDARAAIKFFEDHLEVYRIEMDTAQQAIKDFGEANPEPVRGNRPPGEEVELRHLNDNYDIAAGLFKSARDKLESARLSLSLSADKAYRTYAVIDAANRPTKPSETRKDMLVQIAIFGVAGIVLAVGVVVVATLLDHSVRFEEDARQSFALPVLVTLPHEASAERAAKKKKAHDAPNASSQGENAA